MRVELDMVKINIFSSFKNLSSVPGRASKPPPAAPVAPMGTGSRLCCSTSLANGLGNQLRTGQILRIQPHLWEAQQELLPSSWPSLSGCSNVEG